MQKQNQVPIATWNSIRDCWEAGGADLLSGHSDVFTETWPTSGMTQLGEAYELRTSAHHMREVESSSLRNDGKLLPTPNAAVSADGERPETWLARRERMKASGVNGNGMGDQLTIVAQGFPGGEEAPWGEFDEAIRWWESVSGYPAPAPIESEPAPNGARKITAAFTEWMMGLSPGWVTSPHIEISRKQQLKMLGNGVVPQQAELALSALRQWLDGEPVEAATGTGRKKDDG